MLPKAATCLKQMNDTSHQWEEEIVKNVIKNRRRGILILKPIKEDDVHGRESGYVQFVEKESNSYSPTY